MKIQPVNISPQRFGTAVRALREKAGMSGKELAQSCRLSALAISKIENGTRMPTRDLAQRILKVLGLPKEAVDWGLDALINQSQEFRTCLRKARERSGISLRELGAKIGISHASLHKIEGGRFQPTVSTALDIVGALDLSEEEQAEMMTTFLKNPLPGKLIPSVLMEVIEQAGFDAVYEEGDDASIVVSFGEHLHARLTITVLKDECSK